MVYSCVSSWLCVSIPKTQVDRVGHTHVRTCSPCQYVSRPVLLHKPSLHLIEEKEKRKSSACVFGAVHSQLHAALGKAPFLPNPRSVHMASDSIKLELMGAYRGVSRDDDDDYGEDATALAGQGSSYSKSSLPLSIRDLR